jgi:hypothetical protein
VSTAKKSRGKDEELSEKNGKSRAIVQIQNGSTIVGINSLLGKNHSEDGGGKQGRMRLPRACLEDFYFYFLFLFILFYFLRCL